MESLPNFIFKCTSGEISNKISEIKVYRDLQYISYDKSLHIWNLKYNTLIKSLTHKKYRISTFILQDGYLIIGLYNGLIQIYKIETDYEKYSEYKIHSKKIVKIFLNGDNIVSTSSEGLIMKYNIITETYEKIASISRVDAFDMKDNIMCAGNTDGAITVISNGIENIVIHEERIKEIIIIDEENILFFNYMNKLILYNIEENTQKMLNEYKKVRKVKFVNDMLIIITNKKILRYQVKKEKDKIKLIEQSTIQCKQDTIDFVMDNNNHIFLLRNNGVIYNKKELIYHENEITKVERDINDRLCTFSKDKLIIWNIGDNAVIYNKIDLDDGQVFCLYDKWYVIATEKSVFFYNISNLSLFKEIKIDGHETKNIVLEVSKNEEHRLLIGINKNIKFYNNKLEVVDEMHVEDYLSSIKSYKNMLLVGLLNSKVYVFDKNKDLHKTLYGHALPVVHINVKDDIIYTIGLDKMLKIWGMEFGDCRKSIIVNDARNLEVLGENVILVGGTTLKYYKKFKVIYEKKYLDSNLIYLCKDMLIGINTTSLNIYDISEYELDELDEESEVSDVVETALTDIIDLKTYDEFLNLLDDSSRLSDLQGKFDRFIKNINLGEIDKYTHLLTPSQITNLLYYLSACDNLVIKSRMLISIYKNHKEMVNDNSSFEKQRVELVKQIKLLRDKFGKNIYKMMLAIGIQEFE